MTVYEVNFENFGWREIEEAKTLLDLFFDDKFSGMFHDIFEKNDNNITIGFNDSSGYVWLQDENYNIAMEHNGKLDIFFNTPDTGEEGFYDDLSEAGKREVIYAYNIDEDSFAQRKT